MYARGRMCAQGLHDPGAAGIARSIIKFAKNNPITCNQCHYYHCVMFVWLFCILLKKFVPSWVFGSQ